MKKMFPKVNRNTEIVLDRDTKQQMIILQREPTQQPNRRAPAPKQAPRRFCCRLSSNICRKSIQFNQRLFNGMARSVFYCLF